MADFSRCVEVLATSDCTEIFPDAVRTGELDIAVSCDTDNFTGEPFLEQQLIWAKRSIFTNPDAPQDLVTAMANAIKKAI